MKWHSRTFEILENLVHMAPPSTCERMSGSSLAMHRWVLEPREKVLGREHPDTLTSVSNLGNVLFIQVCAKYPPLCL